MQLFQSRNRESYLFKEYLFDVDVESLMVGFNLVIESLIFSSHTSGGVDQSDALVSIS